MHDKTPVGHQYIMCITPKKNMQYYQQVYIALLHKKRTSLRYVDDIKNLTSFLHYN